MLLAIDTATSAVTAAVHDGTRVLASESVPDARRHAETLTPTIDSVMAHAGLSPRDLDAVAVGVGPGPFTGLRVGIVTATTLGLALGIPVHAVCSLDAIAHEIASRGEHGEFLVATDARRKEVYWARYTVRAGGVARLGDPAVSTPAALDPAVRALPTAGRGPLLYPADFGVVVPVTDVDAGALAGLVVHRLEHGGELLPPTPLYLRQPDAQPSAAQKSVLS
ncbi:tRNA (adenosine(37)-N6)-threonylcarbamoyltransferase complex dimerization subunit type 1 TsaB [Allobranchiibius sp. CTAmp26]|uniref:tRNA (adenosine(37)-N6)-threonylcarbamoyltransferase complex dimerization subunit type 1 TsaB n=1 Tax=Allobranchiibius sp. CTAmp26 TaxID=2815214 RepID=UPI001AA0ECFB|nr:tRNA (adenosine(37)-N6)-threonylcarbamoyltransferase complex dimerization subunit type 1 TsaB [Allobranchiibius sp. CTAmp26]MBO1754179.1 tRNA (adenosine(37)-N6)-threonylcarbamoyltransferase complex dimerization subunit type 1 TsaB [Allobranchiibius sp. CTAmp26]